MRDVEVIAACSDLGVMVDGADIAPKEILKNIDKKIFKKIHVIEKENVKKEKESNNKKRNLKYVNIFNEKLYNEVSEIVNNDNIPLTIGGDHSIAIASALASINKYNNLGIIWFDSHGDYNTFDTTITGNLHGLPLAVITGYEKRLLCDFHNGKFYNPKNAVIVGARDLDTLELENLKDAGVTVFSTDDIKKQGVRKIVEEAFRIALKDTNGIHASIDIDLIDPLVAPGVSVKAVNGISKAEFDEIINVILEKINIIKTIDIVEFNPTMDINDVTRNITIEVVNKIISKYTSN